MLHYRYGWPLGRLAAKVGIPTVIKIEVIRDGEAGVFVATSPDLRGLVVEAESFDALVDETRTVMVDLLSEAYSIPAPEMIADLHYQDRFCNA